MPGLLVAQPAVGADRVVDRVFPLSRYGNRGPFHARGQQDPQRSAAIQSDGKLSRVAVDRHQVDPARQVPARVPRPATDLDRARVRRGGEGEPAPAVRFAVDPQVGAVSLGPVGRRRPDEADVGADHGLAVGVGHGAGQGFPAPVIAQLDVQNLVLGSVKLERGLDRRPPMVCIARLQLDPIDRAIDEQVQAVGVAAPWPSPARHLLARGIVLGSPQRHAVDGPPLPVLQDNGHVLELIRLLRPVFLPDVPLVLAIQSVVPDRPPADAADAVLRPRPVVDRQGIATLRIGANRLDHRAIGRARAIKPVVPPVDRRAADHLPVANGGPGRLDVDGQSLDRRTVFVDHLPAMHAADGGHAQRHPSGSRLPGPRIDPVQKREPFRRDRQQVSLRDGLERPVRSDLHQVFHLHLAPRGSGHETHRSGVSNLAGDEPSGGRFSLRAQELSSQQPSRHRQSVFGELDGHHRCILVLLVSGDGEAKPVTVLQLPVYPPVHAVLVGVHEPRVAVQAPKVVAVAIVDRKPHVCQRLVPRPAEADQRGARRLQRDRALDLRARKQPQILRLGDVSLQVHAR